MYIEFFVSSVSAKLFDVCNKCLLLPKLMIVSKTTVIIADFLAAVTSKILRMTLSWIISNIKNLYRFEGQINRTSNNYINLQKLPAFHIALQHNIASKLR